MTRNNDLVDAADRLTELSTNATMGRWWHEARLVAPTIRAGTGDPVGTTWVGQDAEYIAAMGPRVGRSVAHLLHNVACGHDSAPAPGLNWIDIRFAAGMLAHDILHGDEEADLWPVERKRLEALANESHEASSPESHDYSPDAHDESPVTRTAREVLERDAQEWGTYRVADAVFRDPAPMTARDLTPYIEMIRKHVAEVERFAASVTRKSGAYTPGGRLLPDAHDGGLCK